MQEYNQTRATGDAEELQESIGEDLQEEGQDGCTALAEDAATAVTEKPDAQTDGTASLRRYINREKSWLKFNTRVLEEAEDPYNPLLERLKFVAIFASNLDEFFMVRVGSLFDELSLDEEIIDSKSGMNVQEQLDMIFNEVCKLYQRLGDAYT